MRRYDGFLRLARIKRTTARAFLISLRAQCTASAWSPFSKHSSACSIRSRPKRRLAFATDSFFLK